MKTSLMAALCLGVSLAGTSMASAGAIDSACMKAGRTGDRALCGCIQKVADMTLSGSDQRRAAAFFKEPDEAQKVRQSDRSSDESFWLRYKDFAQAAEALCNR